MKEIMYGTSQNSSWYLKNDEKKKVQPKVTEREWEKDNEF